MLDFITTLTLHNALVITHVAGLVIGFGVAISIDYMLLRSLISGRLSPIVMDVAMHAAKLTTFGLLLLWVSGICFLIEYNALHPEKLLNPKIYAKIGIVALLSLNGYIIHKKVLPTLWRYTGGNVLKLASERELLFFAFCATLSTVSWVFPMIFGLNSALNFQYSVLALLAQYVFVLVLGVAIANVLFSNWRKQF